MTRENDDAGPEIVARVERSETRERSSESTGQPRISLRSIRATGAATIAYHRISVAPQVKPPPMASSITRSPRLMRRSATASLSASGIEAAEVLP
jgi:hypothetical protein